jgi:predicted ArsR family transcriptional regulator
VDRIREYNQKLSLEESVKSAIKYCTGNGILKEFLEKYGKEIVKMILEDITVEDEIEAAREERAEEIAKKLKEQGYSTDKIHSATGISFEDIEKL